MGKNLNHVAWFQRHECRSCPSSGPSRSQAECESGGAASGLIKPWPCNKNIDTRILEAIGVENKKYSANHLPPPSLPSAPLPSFSPSVSVQVEYADTWLGLIYSVGGNHTSSPSFFDNSTTEWRGGGGRNYFGGESSCRLLMPIRFQ